LLRRGLTADGFITAGTGVKSQDFGVVPTTGIGPGDGPEPT
jgi:hypothetical protein